MARPFVVQRDIEGNQRDSTKTIGGPNLYVVLDDEEQQKVLRHKISEY